MNVSERDARLLKFLGALNLIPCLTGAVWAFLVITVYINPYLSAYSPYITWWNAYFTGHGRCMRFVPYNEAVIIFVALLVFSLVYIAFQLTVMCFGLTAAKKPRVVKGWRALCFINVFMCLISTSVVAGISAYIFAKLSGLRRSR